MKKVLVATEKPFAPAAVSEIQGVLENAGYELILLENYGDPSELIQAVSDVDALIIRSDKVTAEVLKAAKNLKIVVRAGAGYDNIDLVAATEANVVAMNTPGQNSNAVAELALGMMVYMARNGFNGTAGAELKGKTLGIHAFGNVGKLVAGIAKGFGMNVIAFDPFVSAEIMEKEGVEVVKSVEDLYRNSQYISLNIPANEETRSSIGYEILSLMPEGASLVNTARKEVIDEEGLLKMFSERPDFKYLSDIAPDCYEQIGNDFPGRYFFTPKKMGAQTAEANINAGKAAANQIITFIEEGVTTFKVN